MVAMVKAGKESPQHAYSARDIAWLEKQGWVRVKPQEKQAPVLLQPKRGRPRKS